MVWLVAVLAVNALATFLVGTLGRWLIPSSVGSLVVLSARLGLMLLLLFAVGTLLNVLFTVAFSIVLFRGYRLLHADADQAIAATRIAESQKLRWGSLRDSGYGCSR